MSNPEKTARRWALIIGINYYPNDRCLHGSVRDAESMRRYLEDYSTTAPVEICFLTATTPTDFGPGDPPTEPPESWPTHANVVSQLRRIIDLSKTGDLVYLHFSGHGVRLGDGAGPAENSFGELALVLFEHDVHGASYFRGRQLAGALCRMVDKGLMVTLVLDCCFSGSAVRGSEHDDDDDGVRSLDYDPAIDSASLGQYMYTSNETGEIDPEYRHSRIEEDWLVKPQGYTILSACGPHENAFEVQVEGGGRHGALSYHLLQSLTTLVDLDASPSHKSLHELIVVKIRSLFSQQTPMRYGNPDLSFFGRLVAKPDTRGFLVYRSGDGQLRLRGGHVHGLSQGDKFTPYSSVVDPLVQTGEMRTILAAHTIGPFESDLIVSQGDVAKDLDACDGMTVKLITSLSSRHVPVLLSSTIALEERWAQEKIECTGFLQLTTEGDQTESCMFTVTIDSSNQYEIVSSAGQRMLDLPKTPVSSESAVEDTMNLLHHLAAFKYFEGVENRLQDLFFRKSYTVSTSINPDNSGTFAVRHGDSWGFTVRNQGDKVLYLAVFDFDPSWGIANLVASSGGDDYVVVPPLQNGTFGSKTFRLKMTVPEQPRSPFKRTQVEDVIKVFVMKKPTSFPSMVLPSLGGWDHRSDEPVKHAARLSRMLDNLVGSHHDRNGAEEKQWATHSFIIRTTIDTS